MDEVVEPLEKGLMSEGDFRRFVFENPARLWTASNPAFFDGTHVETDVKQLLDRVD
jgi:hypothetical protein